MIERRVIADSEDEDEDDLCPDHGVAAEPEPLSQVENQSSDVTDPAFFASIFQDQLAVAQQTDLVENIIRASQIASAANTNSRVSSLPGHTNKSKPSFGADVTSPVVLGNPLSEDASGITSPLSHEWDVPSSAEAPRSSARRRTTYGKARRRKTELTSSPEATKAFAAEMTQHNLSNPILQPSPLTTTSAHVISEPDLPSFYVAQSNLTTMQKLEYQKIHVSSNSYSALPGNSANQKSSGVATIAYSTPSGYSSIPTLPWEPRSTTKDQSSDFQTFAPIAISSSPDEIAPVCDLPAEGQPSDVLPSTETTESDAVFHLPINVQEQSSTRRGKRKRRATQTVEEVDELGHDDADGFNDLGSLEESYKPRASKRRTTASNRLPGPDEGYAEETTTEEQAPSGAVAPDSILDLPNTDLPVAEAEPQPRKRGRKRKQPVVDGLSKPDEDDEPPPIEAGGDFDEAPTVETEAPKPKKKRGRPRKSDNNKAIEVAPEPKVQPQHDIAQGGALVQEDSIDADERQDKRPTRKGRRNKKIIDAEEEEIESSGRPVNELPLKEVDRNSKSPVKSQSVQRLPAKPEVEPKDENSIPNQEVKGTTKMPPPAPAQPKVPYRVGLSKRSRIAPLLKIIKK